MKILIESDGTTKGTILTVNGVVQDNINSMNFSCWSYDDKPYLFYEVQNPDVVDEKTNTKMKSTTTYSLDRATGAFKSFQKPHG